MNAVQYEELCRRYIASAFDVEIEQVQSGHLKGAVLPGSLEVKSQIDLYWRTGNDAAEYLNIANAKWRGTGRKIEKGEVDQLIGVKNNLAVHKAFMLSNVGFTNGARAVAQSARISLHVVRPQFEVARLPASKNREAIQSALAALVASAPGNSIWSSQVVYRALEADRTSPFAQSPARPQTTSARGYETRVMSPGQTRAVASRSTTNRGVGSTPRGNSGGRQGPFRRG